MFYWPLLSEIPEHRKIKGSDWIAIFNEAVPRLLDIELQHRLSPSGRTATDVKFSPDGSLLAAGCRGCVRLFDTASGQIVCDLKCDSVPQGDESLIGSTCFLPSGDFLAAGDGDGIIRVWELQSASVSTTLLGHHGPVCSIAVSKDGELMLSGSQDKTLRLWNVASEQQIKVITFNDGVSDIALFADRETGAVAVGQSVHLFKSRDAELMEQLDGHAGNVNSVAFSPSGDKLASASSDCKIKVWAVGQHGQEKSERLLYTFEGHEDLAVCVCWTPDGRWIMSGSKDRSVQIWDPESGNAQVAVVAHGSLVFSLSACPGRPRFASAGRDGSVGLWSYSVRAASPDEQAGQLSGEPGQALGKPGSGLPLNFLPPPEKRFPVLMGDEERDWVAATLLIREICMLKMIEDLTNKPQWWIKVRHPEISAKWKQEALGMDWASYRKYGDFTPAMAEACIDEIRLKADLYEETSLIPVFDYSTCVIKSDKVALDLIGELKTAILPLEDVPEEQRDWHPGSGGKVLDLVHPSLWPLIYGKTRVVTHEIIEAQSCLDFHGLGEVISEPDSSQKILKRGWLRSGSKLSCLSLRFQWLPCDVSIDRNGHTKIDSYINNLHPIGHGSIYGLINSFIERSLPAWDAIYRYPTTFSFQRLTAAHVGPICTTPDVCQSSYECNPWTRPLSNGEPEREQDEPDRADYEASVRGGLDAEWFDATHPVELPDANLEPQSTSPDNEAQRAFHTRPDEVKKSGFFSNASRIQVIVKLANIYLTPDNPTYDGGSWHVEGQLNEHICATALFYYDNENITDSYLAFRARSNVEGLGVGLGYRQNDYRSISRTFAINAEPGSDSTLQDLGSTLTRQGRALFFPNLLQHRVLPFSLADPSKPGHRKILALFLVDPAIPIISTANVPPQQPHWRVSRGETGAGGTAAALDDDRAISADEARRLREELMAERSLLQETTTKRIESVSFSFCEH